MRNLRDKLFPLSAVFLAVLVLVATISILFRLADHGEVLTGPPDLYITLDGEPFFMQESYYNWTVRFNRGSSHGEKPGESFPFEKDKHTTDAAYLQLDFGAYPPQRITAAYALERTGEKTSVPITDHRLELLPGTYYYFITAEWEGDGKSSTYSGIARYNLLIHKTN